MASPRERAQLQAELRQRQQALVRDLLPVLDALDRAELHWQQVLAAQPGAGLLAQPTAPPSALPGLVKRWLGWLWRRPEVSARPGDGALAESASDGIRLIHTSLREALQRHGLEAFESLGQPFDPERMRALGQRPGGPGIAAGAVLEEAVRGYSWHGTLLREAQVVVAAP